MSTTKKASKFDRFSAKLKDGGYESLAGARRAIGKLGLKGEQREKARAAAEKKFA